MLVPSLFTATTVLAVYRFTVNFNGLPFSTMLRRPHSKQFVQTSQQISDAFQTLLALLPGQHNVSVVDYRYQQVIGTLVTIEVTSQKAEPELRKIIENAVRSGYIGRYTVGIDGFEYYPLNEIPTIGCSILQFECRDGSCISDDQRCDGKEQCPDGSDEAHCERKATSITLFSPYAVLLPGDSIRISAKTQDASYSKAQWLHNGKLVKYSATLGSPMVRFYNSSMKHYLLIDNITIDSGGFYEINIDGIRKGISITVSVDGDDDGIITKKCFNGNNCSVVECASNEYLCQIDNFCLPRDVICNGQRDCTDTADEANCNAVPHHSSKKLKSFIARPTVNCLDGSPPEFSLHGSTYCWSNSVCPPDTACIEAKCCRTDPSDNPRRCPSTAWECGDGQCVPLEAQCDGLQTCRDGSDEMHCGSEKRSILEDCGSGYYSCDSGDCIPREKACDRHYDCADGSDEMKCEYFLAAIRAYTGQTNNVAPSAIETRTSKLDTYFKNQDKKRDRRKFSHKRQNYRSRNGNGNPNWNRYGQQASDTRVHRYGYPVPHGYNANSYSYPHDTRKNNNGAKNGYGNGNRQIYSYGQSKEYENVNSYVRIGNGRRRNGYGNGNEYGNIGIPGSGGSGTYVSHPDNAPEQRGQQREVIQNSEYVLPPSLPDNQNGFVVDHAPDYGPYGPPAPSTTNIAPSSFDNHVDNFLQYDNINGEGYHFSTTYGESGSRHETSETSYTSVISNEIGQGEKGYADECSDQEFRCPYLEATVCIHYMKLCDSVDDCGDGSDEMNCSEDEATPLITGERPSSVAAATGCGAYQFQCDNGKCIAERDRCNRKYDCDDGTDETTCDYFKNALRQAATSTLHPTEAWIEATPSYGAGPRVTEDRVYGQIDGEPREEQEEQPQQLQWEEEQREHEQKDREQHELEGVRQEQEEREQQGEERDGAEQERMNQEYDGQGSIRQEEEEQEGKQEQEEQRRQEPGKWKHQEQEGTRQKEELYRQEEERERQAGNGQQFLEDYRKHYEEQEQRRGYEENGRSQQEELERKRLELEREIERRQEEQNEVRRRLEEEQKKLEQSRTGYEVQDKRWRGLEKEVKFENGRGRDRHEKYQMTSGTRVKESEERRILEMEWRGQVRGHRANYTGDNYTDADVRERYEVVEAGAACTRDQYQCVNGECIDKNTYCDGKSDCSDGSDEMLCYPAAQMPSSEVMSSAPTASAPVTYQHIDDSSSQSVQITIYPTEENIHEGRDATFDCRARAADGSAYPEVRWTRYGAPLPPSAYETDGRLTFTSASLSDSGRYVCSTTYGGRNYNSYAQLNVQPYGPQEFQAVLPQSGVCRADERACGNNECVKSDYICDGEPDCRDRSDEQNCPSLRSCEPNEFKCNNGRCVQKMWLCDGDDDCGDNSDEQACIHKGPSDGCSPTEFKCRDGRQCVPQSFHCDGTNDCQDGSDEIGCVQPTIVQAPETNKQVSAGDTFQLTCKAVAVPEPYINWRLNWGPVCDPPRCIQHSAAGVGTLTVNNAQPLDQGAYTCEAINVKGRVLATPDCIVRIVSIPAPESRQLTHCNVIGSVSPVPDYNGRCQCKLLAAGPTCDSCSQGSFNLHEKAPEGCRKCFCFGVTNQCRSSSWYRTKDKLILNGEAQGIQISDIGGQVQSSQFDYSLPGMIRYTQQSYQTVYWKMPSRFLGNKLTAYGGELAFDMQYSCVGSVNNEPLIVLKGNGITLVHRPRDMNIFVPDRNIRYTVDTYETNYEELDGRPATRENLMMVLANLDTMLIRALHCHGQHSTSLGDVSWEIAVDRDTQGRLALEVEQCSCPPGYTGLSCEDCAPGYERSRQGTYLGTCILAQQRVQCSPAGAISTQPDYGGQCQCKTYATGALCDRCPPNTFYMSPRNPQGCIPCFCSGVTQQCSSSNYYRTQAILDYSRGATDQLEITTSDTHSPFSPKSQAQLTGHDITFAAFYEVPGQTLYWKMPTQFLGNKVTSYGGTLKYVIRYSGVGPLNTDADVILRGNEIVLQYRNPQQIYADRDNLIEVKLFEDHWQRMDGQPATREHMLMALADLDDLLIKMSYLDECSSSSLISVSLDYAESHATGGEIAYEVEQCQCPPGYVGTSCEDCAPGYSRTGGGLYLGLCERCECHGHASHCDKEHGFCIDCQHNTEGDQCERCKPGFTGDARQGTPHDCQPAATRPACICNNHSPRGCDSFGRCLLCEHNTEGYHCEQCKRGYYGDATRGTPYDCTPCPCPGASDCFLDTFGQVQCRNCPAGLTGRLCDECAPGYTRSRSRTRVEEGRSCEPIGHVKDTNIVFVPTPEAYGPPLRVQIDPPKDLHVPVGGRARWYCRAVGQRTPGFRLQWSKVGTAGLPSNAAQYDGELTIDNIQESDAGQYRCTGTGDHQFATDDATLVTGPAPVLERPVGRPPPVMIDPLERTVNVNEPATFRCWVPGLSSCELTWYKEDVGGPLPYGVYQSGPVLKIPRAQLEDAGNYICTASNEYGIGKSPPARLIVNRPPQRPRVDPQENTVAEGEPARFRCWVPGDPTAVLTWKMKGNGPLPHGIQQHEGILNIPNAQRQHAGSYICTASDPEGRKPPMDSPVARLIVRPANNPMVDPPEQTVNENEPAQFRCWVPGNPIAILQWRRADGSPLGYGVTESKGTLSIPRAQMSDAGEYICSAQDPDGGAPADSPSARLNVERTRQPPYGPPSPRKPQVEPEHQTVNEGDPAQFRCWVPGDPGARIKWSRADGAPLPYGASDDGSGTLYIPRAHISDADFFVCSVVDPSGGPPIESAPVELKVEPRERRKEVEKPEAGLGIPEIDPPEQTVEEGYPAEIRCFVPGEPGATLTWRKQGGKLPEKATQSNGIIRIPQTESKDAGNYICSMEDPAGGAPVDSVPALINVRRPQAPQVDPRTQTVDEGTQSSIRCWVEGDPRAQLRWSKEDGELPHGAQEIRGILTIPETAMEDAGKYICTAHSLRGGPPVQSPPATINVRRAGKPPRPVATPSDQVVRVGESAQFHCDPNSDTPATVSWGFETAGGPLRGDVIPKGNDLVINSADESNAGDYICTATNEFGTGEAGPVRLHVAEKGAPPTARVEPRVWNGQPGDKHQFQCITTGSPEPTIVWTGPHDEELPDDVTDIGGGFLDFQNARTDMNGDYTCTAANFMGQASDHGSVNIVPTLTVRTNPPGPRIVLTAGEPLEVKCEAFGEPEPEVEWLHDPGPERGDLPDDFKPVTISEQFIRHPSIGLGNTGVYTCKGSNSQASAKKDIYIEVVEPSKVATVSILGGSTQWLEPGKAADLICAATGSEIVDRLQWVKVDGVLPDEAEETESGVLHLSKFKTSDSGEYECRGYRNDELIGSNRVAVYATNTGPLDAARVEIDPPAIRVINQGDSIELTCSVEGGDNNGANFEWSQLRSGSIIRQFSDDSTLVIKRADPSNDYGVYRCEVEDDDGELIGQAYAAVTIGYTDPSNARIVKFDEKSEATIECPVYAVPGARVTWEKEDSELPRGVEAVGNKLMIKEFDDEAVGMYICKVKINGKEIEGYVKAEIYVPDTIIQVLLESSSESIALGDRAWFDCKVTGDPDAEITWSKEGEEELPDNTQVTGNRLLFVNVREDNGGIYKCRAKTKAGPLETRTVLNVGHTKRKRKRLSRKKEKRAHKETHNNHKKVKKQTSIFGTWFTSS